MYPKLNLGQGITARPIKFEKQDYVARQRENFEMYKNAGENVFIDFDESTGGFAFGKNYNDDEKTVIEKLMSDGLGIKPVNIPDSIAHQRRPDFLIQNAIFELKTIKTPTRRALETGVLDGLTKRQSNNYILNIVSEPKIEDVNRAVGNIHKTGKGKVGWLIILHKNKMIKMDSVILRNINEREQLIKKLF